MKNLLALKLILSAAFLALCIGAVWYLFNFVGEQKADSNALERNYELWRNSNIQNYRMKVLMVQAGHGRLRGVFNITVRNRVAESVELVDDRSLVFPNAPGAERYDTIEKIFNRVADARGQQVEVEYEHTLGVPALFTRETFGELLNLQGDTGAKFLIQKYKALSKAAKIDAPEAVIDIDTLEDYERILKG